MRKDMISHWITTNTEEKLLSENVWAHLALQFFFLFASCSSKGCHFWGMCWKLNWLTNLSANFKDKH